MQYLSRLLAVFFIPFMFWGCHQDGPVSPTESSAETFDFFSRDMQAVLAKGPVSSKITAFQAAGPAGSKGVLAEGDIFAPTDGGISKLRRDEKRLKYKIRTTGLPPGAYTNWWVIVNAPSQCAVPNACTLGDVFNSPDSRSTVFWATGGVVGSEGVGRFQAEIQEGESPRGPEGFLLGNGLEDAINADVFIIIKYHGPASSDADALFLQTNTLLGLCDDRANALPNGQCFDPQIAMHHDEDEGLEVSRAETFAFQPAGALGGGVLQPGTSFPPTTGTSSLYAGDGWLGYDIHTDGLPAGAYTNWWVIVNNPEACDGDCGFDDIFGNPATNSSVFWATGGLVLADGVGDFRARIREGQPSKGPDGFLLGNGLQDAENAEVHVIIKYHGPASDDPDALFDQLHTLLGSCDAGANAADTGQCFDPQAVVHRRTDAPDIAATPTRVKFGKVAVGSSKDKTFVLKNEGLADLEINRIRIAGSNAEQYELLDLGTPAVLSSGESRTVTVRFSPTSSGIKKGHVKLFSNDADENHLPVSFKGEGISAP